MILQLLQTLHRKGYRKTLNVISKFGYWSKGSGIVGAEYFPAFRAYAYRIKGKIYLSPGPGWAYDFDYLKALLLDTYCFQYAPVAGDCVVDIGAGLGEEVVVYASMTGPSGKIFALEANPSTFEGLKYMRDENKFTWVNVFNVAAYHEDGKVTIEDDEQNYLTNTINAGTSDKPAFTVDAITLDTFVKHNNITRIDFLKSNIEGAEQFLIQGMGSSIKIIRHLCISCHDFRHVQHQHGEFYLTKEKVRSFLEASGFEVMSRNTGNHAIDDFIYARNRSFA